MTISYCQTLQCIKQCSEWAQQFTKVSSGSLKGTNVVYTVLISMAEAIHQLFIYKDVCLLWHSKRLSSSIASRRNTWNSSKSVLQGLCERPGAETEESVYSDNFS